MNVLMVTSPSPGPFQETVAAGLGARGHSVDVLAPEHPGAALLVSLTLRRRVAARLLARRYEVVHAHGALPNAVLAYGIVAAHGVAFVVSLLGRDLDLAERSHIAGYLAQRALEGADAVTASLPELRHRALALGAPPDRTEVVPDGVDAHLFAPDREHGGVRARLGVGPDAFVVLAVGGRADGEALARVVEAAAKTGGIEVAVVGDEALRPALEARARETGARVRFAGVLDDAALAGAYAAADVVVAASAAALRPALACGRPLVASHVEEVLPFVDDERNGLLVPPGDVAALATVLRRLVREPETRERLAHAARADAVAQWSWEATARRVEETYARAVVRAAR
jgi:glycosyltransferase involved in cell wall biosynthesis